jgi:hypothetical protein
VTTASPTVSPCLTTVGAVIGTLAIAPEVEVMVE